MNLISDLLGDHSSEPKANQAVTVYLDGTHLPNEIYESYDLATLEDRLMEQIQAKSLGEFIGNEVRNRDTLLSMHSLNAEWLFAGIEPILKGYPLCQNARVVIRSGPAGTPPREVLLPMNEPS